MLPRKFERLLTKERHKPRLTKASARSIDFANASSQEAKSACQPKAGARSKDFANAKLRIFQNLSP